MCASFPFGFEGGTWDLIVSTPDHCHFIYLSLPVYDFQSLVYFGFFACFAAFDMCF